MLSCYHVIRLNDIFYIYIYMLNDEHWKKADGATERNDESVIQRCTTHLADATAWPTRTPPPKKNTQPFLSAQ